MKDALDSKLSGISKFLSTLQHLDRDVCMARAKQLNEVVLNDLRALSNIPVDGSVLRASGVVDSIRKILESYQSGAVSAGREAGGASTVVPDPRSAVADRAAGTTVEAGTVASLPPQPSTPLSHEEAWLNSILKHKGIEFATFQAAKNLRSQWKSQVISDNASATLKNLKGGNVMAVKPKDSLEIPSGLPTKLWEQLVRQYNPSQLFAIKYISDKFTTEQDTR